MGKFSPEDLWDLLRYEGWGAPIIVLILVLILLWLNKTRLGLMKCPLKKTVNAIFYVLYVLSFFLTVFTSVIRIISYFRLFRSQGYCLSLGRSSSHARIF